jgi:hypothetical protein
MVRSGSHLDRYHSKSGDYVAFAGGAFMTVALAVLSIAEQHTGTWVICGITFALVVIWLVRWVRAGLYLLPDGVLLRRFFRPPLIFRWSEIAGFSSGIEKQPQWVAARDYRALFVQLVDGQRIKVDGTGETLVDPDYPDRAASALEVERLRRSGKDVAQS